LIFQRIKQGKFSFPDPEWTNVSQGAKELIKKMLTIEPKERITAKDALNDTWI